ncbi:MAG: bacteriochlorophyll 4-vinyl reductase [Chlorobiaceae bacterium]|nr:bacteriochlorophyll 4-vinyl reductase [Chlorobiaceae bacterium]NTV60125.1 bacteriochlorophyll 4-vinyl reductase [Chlorobiaceae bacterium]
MNNSAKIGPNSIIQTVTALEAAYGKRDAEAILRRAGQDHWIGNLPEEMTEESKFHALACALLKEIGEQKASAILEDSGRRTAAYLLRVRIPGLFQKFLRLLPPGPAFRLLLFAISKNAWTFAGSGEFGYTADKKPVISVKVTYPSQPVVGSFYLGTFEALLEELVNPKTSIKAWIEKNGNTIHCTYTCTI